jgi:hypothetical protein
LIQIEARTPGTPVADAHPSATWPAIVRGRMFGFASATLIKEIAAVTPR